MQPMHAALVRSLCKRLGIDRSDDDVQAVAILIVGPAVHLLVTCDAIDALAPQLLADFNAVDRWCERLLANAETLIRAERRRRPAAGELSAPQLQRRAKVAHNNPAANVATK